MRLGDNFSSRFLTYNNRMRKMIFVLLFILLVYTRFVGLDWGLPYPMHPDERNMAVAVTEISFSNIYSPNFWAYGGLQINTAFFLTTLWKIFTQIKSTPIRFEEAVMALRIISACASIIAAVVLIKITALFTRRFSALYLVFFIFQPYFIQFAHFGTTESLLILFYSVIIYYSLRLIKNKKLNTRYLLLISLFFGLALATKVSSLIFSATIIIAIGWKIFPLTDRRLLGRALIVIICCLIISFITSILFSPHYVLYWKQFQPSLLYEKSLAAGEVMVFYTRQFEGTIPVLFQLRKIFPSVLGWPQYILFILGFFLLSWRRKEINVLRFAFLVYFIPNSFLYTKWTRFMAPIFPVMSLFAVFGLISMNRFIGNSMKFILPIFVFAAVLPGIAYLSIYHNPDVRLSASEWIYKNITENSSILSETANVVDIPIENPKSEARNPKPYQLITFNFYDLDQDKKLQEELKDRLMKADYIFVPSRRIFKNHPPEKYPLLNEYYQKLFSGQLGFKKAAEFTSYPHISFAGKTLIAFPDEDAEETWSIFDHPVVRIYKKN